MPVGVSLRGFLPFSPWRASARPRLKSQKSLKYPSPAGAGSFAGAEMCVQATKSPPGMLAHFQGLCGCMRAFLPVKTVSALVNGWYPCELMIK